MGMFVCAENQDNEYGCSGVYKNQSWALPLQVAVIRYLTNSEKISEIAD
jgi:hypothetical protein